MILVAPRKWQRQSGRVTDRNQSRPVNIDDVRATGPVECHAAPVGREYRESTITRPFERRGLKCGSAADPDSRCAGATIPRPPQPKQLLRSRRAAPSGDAEHSPTVLRATVLPCEIWWTSYLTARARTLRRSETDPPAVFPAL